MVDVAKKPVLNLGVACLIDNDTVIHTPSNNETSRLPSTVSCVSRLSYLRNLRHPSLAAYLDVEVDKHKRLFVVTEHYPNNFSKLSSQLSSDNWLANAFLDCLSVLDCLASHHLVHGYLSPTSLLIDIQNNVKVSGYGLFYASRWGLDIDLPLTNDVYSAPEMLLHLFYQSKLTMTSSDEQCPLDSRSDLWSLALIFLEVTFCGIVSKWMKKQSCVFFYLMQELRSNRSTSLLEVFDLPLIGELNPWHKQLIEICKGCLVFDIRQRSTVKSVRRKLEVALYEITKQHSKTIKTSLGSLPEKCDAAKKTKAQRFLEQIDDPAEVYYFWRLAGGDLISAFLTNGANQDFESLYTSPPILQLPSYLHGCSDELWPNTRQPRKFRFCPSVIPLPGGRLFKRLAQMPMSSLYPLIYPDTYCFSQDDEQRLCIIDTFLSNNIENWSSVGNSIGSQRYLPKHQRKNSHGMLFQPVLVKQHDVEYQISRVCLFKRLLAALPGSVIRLLIEARFDIPPFLRAKVWAALLGVTKNDCNVQAAALSVATSQQQHPVSSPASNAWHAEQGSTNFLQGLSEKALSQIAVDLPRCHAYDMLMVSALGQKHLRTVLIASLLSNADKYEYTQGMDSLAAVFTRLFFGDDEMATACLTALLLSGRLQGFFSRQRFTAGLQTYFNILLRILAFHAPSVAFHFASLHVPLTGLTTGWIYTLFAHSMPLDRSELLWDSLLCGPAALPMFVYVAIFHQLNQQVRLQTLNQENICMLLSNFPDFNLDQCREDALFLASNTPLSLTVPTSPPEPLGGPLRIFHQTHIHVPSDFTSQKGHCASCLLDWPKHLDMVNGHAFDKDLSDVEANAPQYQSMLVDYRTLDTSLLPFISVEDVFQHLDQDYCVLLDTRSKGEYSSGCLINSIHFPISRLLSGTIDDSNAPPKQDPLVLLTRDPVWRAATVARNKKLAFSKSIVASASSQNPAQSPGLLILLGNGEKAGDSEMLGKWLIERGIDRVCLVKGGAGPLLMSPKSCQFFVSPPGAT